MGKEKKITRLINSAIKKGDDPSIISFISTSFSATPITANRLIPKGGVINPISMANMTITAYQIGSTPALFTMGLNKATVIHNMDMLSRKHPNIRYTTQNRITMPKGDNPKPITKSENLMVKPVNTAKFEKIVAEPKTKKIMAEVMAVSVSISYNSLNLLENFRSAFP